MAERLVKIEQRLAERKEEHAAALGTQEAAAANEQTTASQKAEQQRDEATAAERAEAQQQVETAQEIKPNVLSRHVLAK